MGDFKDGVQRMPRYLECSHASWGSLAISYFKICKLERHKGERHSVPKWNPLLWTPSALLAAFFPRTSMGILSCSMCFQSLSWTLTRLYSLKILGYRCCSDQKWFVFVLTATWYIHLMAFFNMAFLIYLLNLPLLETLIFFNFLEAIKPSAVDIWERMVWCHFLIISFINSWALNF